MAGYRELADKRGLTVHHLRRSKLIIDPKRNARDLSTPDNRPGIEQLAKAIDDNGWISGSIVYVTMRQGEAIISQGHRRIAAVDLLIEQGKWDEGTMLIPTLLEPAGTGDLELFVNQFTTNDSEPLKPREAAYNIMRIKSLLGGNLDETAKRIGRSRSYVDQLLRFNEEATPEVHEAIAKGEISQTQAATILRKEGAKKGAATIREAVATAKASGKKKATKRDVEAAKPTASPLLNDLYVRVEHITPVQTAAIVLARDFLERVEFEFADPATCKEAGRIVAELNHALGEPAQMAAE
jgi:hypothetical protein